MENKEEAYKETLKNDRNAEALKGGGLSICRDFFEEFGRPMLSAEFPELFPVLCAGVFGQGSECFGYDDAISRDHDFDPGFLILLPKPLYEKYGFRLYRAYERLPKEYRGLKRARTDFFGPGRRGVFSVEDYFTRLIGMPGVPESSEAWMTVPGHALAEAVNGMIFYDGSGTVSAIRDGLSAYYPEDVRLKKLAAEAALAAQSGQYNFGRCMEHGECEAAALSLHLFCMHALSLLFLLSKEYQPYYKWAFRRLSELPGLSGEKALLQSLSREGVQPERQKELSEKIEALCGGICEELRRQALSELPTDFLEPHAYAMMEKIKDGALRNLHVMA